MISPQLRWPNCRWKWRMFENDCHSVKTGIWDKRARNRETKLEVTLSFFYDLHILCGFVWGDSHLRFTKEAQVYQVCSTVAHWGQGAASPVYCPELYPECVDSLNYFKETPNWWRNRTSHPPTSYCFFTQISPTSKARFDDELVKENTMVELWPVVKGASVQEFSSLGG